jgi:ABC-2 type transport system permease protein
MRGEQPGPTASQQPSRGSLAAREPGAPVRARLALYWLALYRRRRMLLGLALGMVAFETLIIVITRTIPPQDMFAGSIRQPPSAFRAFSGSSGVVSLASYPGLVGAGLVHPFWIAMQLTVVGSFGAAAVAADVEAGTIELLMVRPISRARLLAERTAALVTGSVLVTVAAIAAVAVGVAATPRLHEAVSLAGVAAAGMLGLGLALCIAGPVLAVSGGGRPLGQVVCAPIALGAVGLPSTLLPRRGRPSPFFASSALPLLHASGRAGQRHHPSRLPGGVAGRLRSGSRDGRVAAGAQGPRPITASPAEPLRRGQLPTLKPG